jgi:MoaA/NifB/PqqE/SkfB family radical SAM enzyme
MCAQLNTRAGPDGIHWFDRSTGINILLDEISVPTVGWSQAPRQVSVALTNACDLRCPYCYAPKHRAQLNYERLVGWLSELDAAGCFSVGFGGGEPTMHKDFARLCAFATTRTKLAVTFTTHAHRLNDRLANELIGNVHFIRVSMDGVGTTYEALRGKGFTQFQRQLELVKGIARFGINFVVNSSTFPDIDSAVALAVDSGASEFLLLPERATSKRSGINEMLRTALRRWVSAPGRKIRLAISEADAHGFPICDPLVGEKGLRSYAHIDASGFLKSSSFDRSGVAIGPMGVLQALEQLRLMTGRVQ